MRRCRTVVVGLGAVTAAAVLDAGLEHAHAAQRRATLQVTVQVVAPCAARLDTGGRLALDAACEAQGAPFAVATEGAVPGSPAVAAKTPAQMPATTEIATDLRYITLLY